MSFTAESLFIDFCTVSVLIFLAKLIRIRVKFFQNHLIPTALIAGFLAVLLGKNILNILPFSESISDYSGPLQIMLSASLFVGAAKIPPIKKMLKDAGDSFFLNAAAEIGQFAIGILVGYALASTLFPEFNGAFGVLMPAGFAGSHGTAALVSSVFESAGYHDAYVIGQTFATVGLLTGVFAGVFFINVAVKRGYTKIITKIEELPDDMKTGLIPEEEQKPFGRVTVNSMSLETLCWHITLVLVAVGIGYGLSKLSEIIMPSFSIPVYGVALLGGIILQQFLCKTKLNKYTDEQIVKSIGGTVTDYMVVFGIASIDFSLVFKYWKPMLILCIVAILFSVFFLFVISKHCFKDFWFEKGIFVFGWCTAAMPVALMLLKLVDPDFKSDILKQASFAWIFLTLVEIAIITFVPVFIIRGYGVVSGIVLAVLAIAAIVLCRRCYSRKTETN